MFACVAALVIAYIRQDPFCSERWHWSYWLVLTQLLFFPAIVAVGVLFRASTEPPIHANVIGEHLLDILLYVSLAAGCFWIYRMKGLRWFAASLVGVLELLVLCAAFTMGMIVSGEPTAIKLGEWSQFFTNDEIRTFDAELLEIPRPNEKDVLQDEFDNLRALVHTAATDPNLALVFL